MNLYEVLGAPPTLSSKDMSMHIRMMPSTLLTKEQRTQYGGELLNSKTRLYNELKTLRFPPRPGANETNSLYLKACKMISHASGDPIPYRFFKAEFEQLLKDCGYTQLTLAAELDAKVLGGEIERIADIWRYQSYAALLLRIAENSEESDPKNAHMAWNEALKAYQRFFAKADVKDSCTYRDQTEEKFRKDCREAWDGFLTGQLEGVGQRLKRYIQKYNTASMNACFKILELNISKSIAKVLPEDVMPVNLLLLYTSAIRTAPSLAVSGEMYNNCPKTLLAQDDRGECKRAMLGALKKATDQLMTGSADVTEIIHWADKLKVTELYQKGALLLKKDTDDFFEACARFIRDVIQDKKFDRVKEMEFLVTILPEDFVVAKSDKDDLHPSDIRGLGVILSLGDTFEKGVSASTDVLTATLLGSRVYKTIDSSIPKGTFRDKTLGRVNSFLVMQLQNKKVSHEAFQAFIEKFPDNWPIDIPEVYNFGELKRKLMGDPVIAEALRLLKEAREAEAGSYSQETKIKALINFACAHPHLDLGQNDLNFTNLVDQTLIQAFVSSINVYMKLNDFARSIMSRDMTTLRNAISMQNQAKDVMQICGSFLPRRTKLPAEGSANLTTDSLMGKLKVTKDKALAKRRKQYDRSRVKRVRGPKPEKVPRTKSPKTKSSVTKSKSIKSEPTHTKLNGIQFRGGTVAAGIQYFLWMLILPAGAVYGMLYLMKIGDPKPYAYDLIITNMLILWAALLLSGVFGLMANSYRDRASNFGHIMRSFVWMGAILATFANDSFRVWPESVFVRVLLGVWSLVMLLVMHTQLDKHSYYHQNVIKIDSIDYHGGGITVFFKYLTVQMIVPCIVASLIYIFSWQLSTGWIFLFKLFGVALALSILRVFFLCLAQASSMKRFAGFMSTEIFLLVPPVCGWYAIHYFNAFPLKWWVIVLYSVYGLIFLIGTIAAAQSKD